MRQVTFFIFFLSSLNLFSQSGTLLVSTVTEQGIIMAADSRGCIFETKDISSLPLAYFDSACKIYPLKQFTISIGGPGGIGSAYYSEIISDFNKTSFKDTGLFNTYKEFTAFLDKRYPISKYPERKNNKFILGGYVNGIPKLLGVDTSNRIVQSKTSLTSDSKANKYFNTNGSDQDLTIIELIEKAIYAYAEGENKEHTVGGPISFLLIKSNNEIRWIKNDFSINTYKNAFEFYEAVSNDMVKMHYLVPEGKTRLLKAMRR